MEVSKLVPHWPYHRITPPSHHAFEICHPMGALDPTPAQVHRAATTTTSSSSFSPSFLPHLIQSKFYQIADQFTNPRSPPFFPSNQASTTQLTSGPLHKGT